MRSPQTAPVVHSEVSTLRSPETVDQLVAENQELKRQVQRLKTQHASLAHRLKRVEDSQIFRFLGWFGGRLLDLPAWVLRVVPLRRLLGPGATVGYKEWIQQTATMDLASKPGEPPRFRAAPPLVSVVVWDSGRNRSIDDSSTMVVSIRKQSHESHEVHFCGSATVEDFLKVLAQCKGEFVAILSADVILEQDAIESWVKAAASGIDLVYSDWDHLDSQGQRHSPRWTPEFSPTLLEQVLYCGGCFLARADALRTMPPLEEQHDRSLPHRLAIAVARPGRVTRIPRILWHQTGDTAPKAPAVSGAAKHVPRVEFTASIVICSRSPKRLRKCLASLQPTIDARTEIVVVCHEAESHFAQERTNLDSVASEFGAKAVAYTGGFHFGLMNEMGARAATGAILVFLNDDVYPIATDWLDRMASQAIKDDVGAVGALLYYPSGRIQHSGIVVGGMVGATHVGQFMREAPHWPWLKMSREVTAVTGACLALRRQVWDELGGFDPRFPVNYNDTDLCLRLHGLGYRVVLEAGATLTHEESQTRQPGVSPEELARFADLWGDVLEKPDPYFHPELIIAGRDIQLRSPWARLR